MDRQTARQVGDFLRQGAWFRGLGAPVQEALLARAVLRQFDRGQVLQVEDSHGPGLAAILKGSLRFLQHVRDGAPTLMHIGQPGFWFGQAVVAHGKPVVTVEARTATTAVVVPPCEFGPLAQSHPDLLAAVHAVINERARLMYRFHAEARALSGEARLRLRLADLADPRSEEIAVAGPGVELDLSQSELAAIVGLSRQRANAFLQALQRDGLVVVGRSKIQVLDPPGLRASAAAPEIDRAFDESAEAAERAPQRRRGTATTSRA